MENFSAVTWKVMGRLGCVENTIEHCTGWQGCEGGKRRLLGLWIIGRTSIGGKGIFPLRRVNKDTTKKDW